MRKRFQIPNLGERELNQLTSWGNISRGATGLLNTGKRFANEFRAIQDIHAQNQAGSAQRGYGMFTQSLMGARGHVGGFFGSNINTAINTTLQKIKALGGIQIKSADLGKAIGGLEKRLESISRNVSGDEKAFLDELRKTLQGAKGKAEAGGFAALAGSSRGLTGISNAAIKTDAANQSIETLSQSFRTLNRMIGDSDLSRSITAIKQDMVSAAAAAKDAAGKFKAISTAEARAKELGKTATGADKLVVEQLTKEIHQEKKNLGGNFTRFGIKNSYNALSSRLTGIAHSIGGAVKYFGPAKRMIDTTWGVFQQINSKFNQIAQTQMGISSERGGYGRQIRGAGINFHDMMAAIGAGRKAGMDDRQIVSQMVSLQESLAKARWGEGPLIENMGKWGLTPYAANGDVKSDHEIMIDFSRKLNSITDKMEKLQFLNMQGFRPEQMEYVANYERNARRMEYLKANPNAAGILDRADILDQNGMSAKIDAATRIELKRRQILNQNAWDKGIGSGLLRTLHPENWAFSDWTARQRGLASAKSEVAIEKLNRELENVRKAVVENKGALKGNTSGLAHFSAKTLENLSLTGGKAEADIRDKGEKSGYYQLRKLYAAHTGAQDLNKVRAYDRREATARGGVVGTAIGAGSGALAGAAWGAALTSWSGPGAIIGAGIGAILGAITGLIAGAASGYSIGPGRASGYGMDDHIKNLQKMRKKKDRAGIEQYIRDYDLGELDWNVVASKRFKNTEKAREILTGAWVAKNIVGAQALTSKKVDAESAVEGFAHDKYFKADQRAARMIGKEVTKAQLHGALARAGSGDKRAGVDSQTAYNYIRYGFDTSDKETQLIIAKEEARLAREKGNKGKTPQQIKSQATQNVKKSWIHNLSPEDIKAARQKEAEKPKLVEEEKKRAAEEWDDIVRGGEFVRARGRVLSGGEEDMVQNVISGDSTTFSKDYENVIDRLKELDSKTKLSSEEEAEQRWLNRLSQIHGHRSKESYVAMRARAAQRSGTSQLAEIERELEGTSTLWKSYTAQEQAQKFNEFREKNKGQPLEKLITQFAVETGADKEDVRRNLALNGTLTDEEAASYQKSREYKDKKKAEERKKKEEDKKAKRKRLAFGATSEDVSKALGDEGEAEYYQQLAKDEREGKDLTDKQKKFLEEKRAKVASYMSKKEAEKETEQESKEEVSEEEQAALDAVVAEGKQAEAAAAAEKGKRPLAEMSDINRMYDLQKRGGFTDEMLARHFGADRLAQYKDAMEKGEIGQLDSSGDAAAAAREEYRKKLEKKYAKARMFGDDEQNEEWKKATIDQAMEAYDLKQQHKADAEAALDAYAPNRKKKASLSVDYGDRILPGFGKGKSDEATEAMQESAAQATTAMKNAVEKGETAAATGNIAATGGAAGGAAGTTEKNVNNDVKQSIVLNINGEFPVNEEGVKAGAKAGMMEYGSSLAQLLSSKAFTSIA